MRRLAQVGCTACCNESREMATFALQCCLIRELHAMTRACFGRPDARCLFRMLWSFARDGGVPMHRVFCRVSTCTGTPVNAVWAMAALAFLVGLPMLYSLTFIQALASISSAGLYTSCECARSAA